MLIVRSHNLKIFELWLFFDKNDGCFKKKLYFCAHNQYNYIDEKTL